MQGLYIHIPFCDSLCHYCAFTKQIRKNIETEDEYITRLIEELFQYKEEFVNIDTIYIGGGTPSCISIKNLERLLIELKNIKAIEYTLEINPESYTKELGDILIKYGVNRVSIGIQTFNSDLLKSLNRKHTNSDTSNAISHLKSIGITNISIDLIYQIPGQKIEDVKSDLKKAISLGIKHVSYYGLILEERTYFHYLHVKNKLEIIDEELQVEMYETIVKYLEEFGYKQYEISSFALNGYQSKHNIKYWTLEKYIGIGLSAHGFDGKYRYSNTNIMSKYLKKEPVVLVKQEHDDNISDEFIFGLRMNRGVNIKYIQEKYNIDIFTRYVEINKMIDDDLLEITDGNLMLTNKGRLLSNIVELIFID